ncbi:BTAD domain-containing putative transcriptional regulator [Streptomyces sp. CA-181903]|uniref:AfsR/SARP family transcriptional regulator n=1 Tax=Streptomyces sp. CA-181903 TaxID=3240055 RepID=UPI003D923BA9
MEPDVRLLGAVGVRLRGRWARPGPPRQQAVLAMLLLRRGRPVTVDELIDGVWGQDAPARAVRGVRTYAWALRALLEPGRAPREPAGLLLSDGDGYALRVPPDTVDAHLFERHLRTAREARERGDAASAHGALGDALALWGGEPLAGVPGPHAEGQRTRLLRLRIEAQERYFDHALDLGMHGRAVPELSALTEEHPLNECFRGLLMRALDGCGRRAEALEVYAGTRRLLAAELGVPPGRELAALHARLTTGERRPVAAPTASPAPHGSLARGGDDTDRACGGREFPGHGTVLDALEAVLTEPRDHDVPVAVVTGPGGAGKTALATRLAHRVAAAFPDGRVHVDLRGSRAGRIDPGDVLARLLRTLGVPAGDTPAQTGQRAALYRSLLAGRRVLVVLDDALDAAQVGPLLPGSPGSAVVITARGRALVLPGAVHRELPPRQPPATRSAAVTAPAGEMMPVAGMTPAAAGLASGLAHALDSLARSGEPDLPIERIAALLRTGREEAERIAESLVDAGLLDTPAYGRYRLKGG